MGEEKDRILILENKLQSLEKRLKMLEVYLSWVLFDSDQLQHTYGGKDHDDPNYP